jgi:deoxyinosine 3'endonuclease (endonuclease V)
VGVLCDIPTIGCAKTLLSVDGLTRIGVKSLVNQRLKKGIRTTDLVGESGMVWGRAIVPPTAKANPVFVSIGHRVDLDTAVDIVTKCCAKFRVPAPVRHADLRSREELRKSNGGNVNSN